MKAVKREALLSERAKSRIVSESTCSNRYKNISRPKCNEEYKEEPEKKIKIFNVKKPQNIHGLHYHI